jgi:tetratricopeptide (TPR) repeat protein
VGLLGLGCAASRKPEKVVVPVPEDHDPVALLERGKAYASIGDLVRAEQYLTAALAWGGDENVILPALLRVCVAARHYRLASEYAENALTRNPKNAHLRFLAGALYVSIGDPVRARQRLEEAARDLAGNPEVQFSVAVFFRDELSDKVGADPYFREYLRIAPTGAHAVEARASLMERVE